MKQPWFGDRLFGIGGLRPVTWQGWLVASALIALLVVDGRFVGFRTPLGILIFIAACAGYAIVGRVTSRRWWSWGPFGSHRRR
jgi:hypothetical protein